MLDAAHEIMREAYLKASGGGTLPVKPRQIMYAARGHIQGRTGKKLDDRYFCQTILPDYCAAHGDDRRWDIVWDARGNLVEPHTNHQVPLGTLEVRDYIAGGGSRYLVREQHGGWSTCGPDDRFGAVLFVEKEGFMPLFRAVKLAERYDLAIMSTKGLSTTAARQLVDHFVGKKKVPVFCIRDFDDAGFKIAGTLRQGTRRYSWRSGGAVDLGPAGRGRRDLGPRAGGGVLQGRRRAHPHRSQGDQGENLAHAPELRRDLGGDRHPPVPPGRAERLHVRPARRVDRGQAGRDTGSRR